MVVADLIDIGDVPQWFIAIAAAAVAYKVWKTNSRMDDVVEKIERVRHETNSMRASLELASKAEGRIQGRQEMRDEIAIARDVAKEVVRADAIADAQTSAAVRAADPEAPPPATPAIDLKITASPNADRK